jgi:DNA-binding CsgD family transcriptional regulator
MGRRGRPPYPDILTPRQWEVLDLVRRGLSDQEIADALDLTLAGAKYHVSEILTKLGVSSREEAAAWQPPEGRPTRWGRALALSLAVKIAGAAVVIAAAAGVGLLAWGTLRSDDSGNARVAPVFEDLALPSPLTHPQFSREQALVQASEHSGGDIRAADVQVSRMTAISHAEGDFSPQGSDDRTGWLVPIRSFGGSLFPELGGPGLGGPLNSDSGGQTYSAATCVEYYAYFPDLAQTDPGWSMASSSGLPLPASDCNVQLSGDAAIVLANIGLSGELQGHLPDRIQTAQLPLADAVARFHDRGVATTLHPGEGGDPVWLVVMTGHFFGASSPTPVPDTPHPTTTAPCRIAMAIVSQDGVLAAGSAPSTDC